MPHPLYYTCGDQRFQSEVIMTPKHVFKVGDVVRLKNAGRKATITRLIEFDEKFTDTRDVISSSFDTEFEMACDTYRKEYDCEFCPGDGGDPYGRCCGPIYLVADSDRELVMPAYESELENI